MGKGFPGGWGDLVLVSCGFLGGSKELRVKGLAYFAGTSCGNG